MVKSFLKSVFYNFINSLKKIVIFYEYENYRKKYNISSSFIFKGEKILFYGNGKINIKEDSYIGWFSTLQASSGYEINIGKGCQISHNVRIYTLTAIADQDFSNFEKKTKGGNVTIENYCWIGANVFINPGIHIGENSIIGANSVVTKNIPPYSIYGGVPAKLIRKKNIDVA